ncbi:unnamed protein product [Cyclocybe aegerita]|uniref:HMG box domain-containing protein n=1 Tax=Cyclocybe aegerita TaxID=1973307 RepID=A0A8S0WU01_CYCAE|nr:unnamed protein product [Cyclocybe aegerita]
MPAERTNKALKRSDSMGNQFVWAPQHESQSIPAPASSEQLSFATNMTPFTFNDGPPPLVDAPPTEFILFPPPEESNGNGGAPSKRTPHSKKKPENHIPRPPNAFILFRSSFIKSQHVSTEVETNHSTLSKIIGLTWQGLSEDERQIWHTKAKEALDDHKRKFPKYAFRPVQTRTKGGAASGAGPGGTQQQEKRKVREVEPKDIKRCTKIAQLLVEGKKGTDLESAIQEFDKHHVPEIVTRFEAPITARSYRRSSSAPVEDTENSRASGSFLQSVISGSVSSPSKKRRAASTRCSTPQSLRASSPKATPSPVVHAQALPLKQETSMAFSAFSFDNIASSPLPTTPYDQSEFVDPLSSPFGDGHFNDGHFNPGLTIDTSFDISMADWPATTSTPSPMTPMSPAPTTPEYLLSPNLSPMISSPTPSFAASFDAFDQLHEMQGKQTPFLLDDFSSHFGMDFSSPCGAVAEQHHLGGVGVQGMCGGVMGDASMYAQYQHAQPQIVPAFSSFDAVDEAFTGYMSAHGW